VKLCFFTGFQRCSSRTMGPFGNSWHTRIYGARVEPNYAPLIVFFPLAWTPSTHGPRHRRGSTLRSWFGNFTNIMELCTQYRAEADNARALLIVPHILGDLRASLDGCARRIPCVGTPTPLPVKDRRFWRRKEAFRSGAAPTTAALFVMWKRDIKQVSHLRTDRSLTLATWREWRRWAQSLSTCLVFG